MPKNPHVSSTSTSTFLLASASVAAALYGLSGPAHAQDAAAQQQDETVTAPIVVEGDQLNEGYSAPVAASPKYTAPIKELPKSVTIVNEEVLKDTGATSLEEALRTVPGITMAMGEGGQPFGDRPVIRGSSADTNIFINGVRDTGSQQREIFDIEQIEVTKGADSAYSGRGSAGGAINLVTKTPKGKNFIAGTAGIGTDNYKRLTADVNQVIDDQIAVRLNAMWHDADVPGRDEVDESRWGFAPSVTFGLHSDTRATLSYYHLQTDDMPDYGLPLDTTTGTPVSVDRDNFYGLTSRDFQKVHTDIGTLELVHDFSDTMSIRNVTTVSRTGNDYIVTNPDDSKGNVVNGRVYRGVKSRDSITKSVINQTDLSGEFETSFIKHTYSAGIEFSFERTTNENYSVDTDTDPLTPGNQTSCPTTGPSTNYNCTDLFNPNPGDPWNGSVTKSGNPSEAQATTYSAYVLDTMRFNAQWALNLGLRFDSYHSKAQSRGTSYQNDESFLNYQAGVVYTPVPAGTFYANFASTSTPSGTDVGSGGNSLGGSNSTLEPERSYSYELGTKWNVLDNLFVTAAVFRTETENAKVATAPGRGAPEDTIGEIRIQGYELGIQGAITPRWNVIAGYSYLDSEIIDAGPASTDEGNRFPQTPENAFSLWSTYDVLPQVQIGGGAYFVDRQYGNDANTKSISPYWRFDAMASYAFNDNVTFRLNVENLLDRTYFERVYTTHMATLGNGRRAILTADFKF